MGVSAARSALYRMVGQASCLSLILILAISIAAPGQAVGGPAPAVRERTPAGASPSPALQPQVEHFFAVPKQIGPPLPDNFSPKTDGITLGPPDEDDDERTVALTPEEYQKLKRLLKISGAPASQVAAVTGLSVGVVVLIAGVAYIILMVIFRYVFNRWFDADVYNQTWPSVAVICTMILGGVILLAAAVLR